MDESQYFGYNLNLKYHPKQCTRYQPNLQVQSYPRKKSNANFREPCPVRNKSEYRYIFRPIQFSAATSTGSSIAGLCEGEYILLL